MCELEDCKDSICIDVEVNGRIVKFEDKLTTIFSVDIQKGQQIDDIIPALYGYFPITKDNIILENINIDLFKGNIIIKQENNEVRIHFYPKPQAIEAWQQEIQQHNQEELIKKIVMKTESKSMTCNVLYTLDFMTFIKSESGFDLMGDIPKWFRFLFPKYNYSSKNFDLEELFPFLEVFTPDMEALFGKEHNGKVVSGLWTETSEVRGEIVLQAIAVNDNGHNFLFLESISDRNPDKQKNLQMLREQTLMLDQIKKTEEVLRNVLKTREQFISIFSHDIKGPIGGVYSMIELLRNDDNFMSSFKENHIHLLDVMYKSLRDLHDYSNKLYDWSNVNFGNMTLDKTPTDLNVLMNDIITNVGNKTIVKHIKINTDIPTNIKVLVDPVFFKNAIYNIITNAIKFSNPMSSIEISAVEFDTIIQLVIKDSGIGIEQKVIDLFFNFNKKVSNVGTNGEKGTGIGLTIVKKILDMHKAKFDIKSKIGEGTEIIIGINKV